MSGLVLPVSGGPLKPALKISGENRRRFYFEVLGGVSEAQPEHLAVILSASKPKTLLQSLCKQKAMA